MTFCEPGGTAACRTEQLFELLSGSHSDGKGIRILVFFFWLPLSQIRGHVLPHCFPTQPQPWSRGSLFLFEVVTSGTLEIVSEGEEE